MEKMSIGYKRILHYVYKSKGRDCYAYYKRCDDCPVENVCEEGTDQELFDAVKKYCEEETNEV